MPPAEAILPVQVQQDQESENPRLYQVSPPQTPWFSDQAKEPFQAHFTCPPWGCWHYAGKVVEGAAGSQDSRFWKLFEVLRDPLFLSGHSHPNN